MYKENKPSTAYNIGDVVRFDYCGPATFWHIEQILM